MKKVFCGICAAALIIGGCGEKSGSSGGGTNTTSSGGNPLNAPADYVGALGKAQQNAVKTADTTSINKAIQMFTVDQGRNPKDLNELVEKKYLPQLPTAPAGMKLDYDANAGTARVVKQ
jgi:hypothetical protein